MKVELHIIQNFAPSCLNRDDTNTPKDCEFGGHRRARISSQCIKRAVRWNGGFQEQLAEYLSSRSLRFPNQVAEQLQKMGVAAGSAKTIGKSLQDIAKKEAKDGEESTKKGGGQELDILKTPQIIFYTSEEVQECAKIIKSLLDQGMKPQDCVKEIRNKKSKHFLQLPKPRSADIALFGRMTTSDHFMDVDAACQVAHAISTNKVMMDMDFYTAVDDLQPKGETGAGMMGITGFNSSCFYRYSLVDTKQLWSNLGEDKELSRKTLEAFLRASVSAIPTGKQNSMAAHNPPEVIFAVVREKGAPMSLANAFITPIRPSKEKSLMQASIEAMDDYWGRLTTVYGENGVKSRPICLVGDAELKALKDQQVGSFDKLVTLVLNSVPF